MDYSLHVNNFNNDENVNNSGKSIIENKEHVDLDCDLDPPVIDNVNRKRKLEETLHYKCFQQQNEHEQELRCTENVQQLVNEWIAEYNKWYKISNIASNTKESISSEIVKDVIINGTTAVESTNVKYSQSTSFCVSTNQQINPLVILPQQCNKNNKGKYNRVLMGYWGPLLRYGTYGVHVIHNNNINMRRDPLSQVQAGENKLWNNKQHRQRVRYPLDIPLRIRIPRQAMICTLQSKMQSHLYNLKKLEKDPLLHMNINYSNMLEQVTSKCGTCPKYLFTKVKNIPVTERQYFTNLEPIAPTDSFLSIDGSLCIDIKSTNEFYACELFISDIIISQGFAIWKRRAREICARNAFRVLENQCYLVGSTRFWYGTEYMTACITDDPSKAPMLPPFLTDPTEPLYKKDEKINESDRNENFDVLNPKSIHDFWLYATHIKSMDNIKSIDSQMLLHMSAEFSQMNLSFEIVSCWDESFSCTIMLDKSPAIKVDGLGSLEQACQAAAMVLIDKLVDTQPIVTLTEAYHQQYVDLVNHHDLKDNKFLVQGLMWTQSDSPIDFEDLSNFITPETILSSENLNKISSKKLITNQNDLEYFLNIYAQSSLVSSLKLTKKSLIKELWLLIPQKVKKCGLVVMSIDGTVDDEEEAFLICKQVPHTQLKAKLLRDKEFRIFKLLSRGNLPSDYLSNLNRFIGYDNLGDLHSQSDNDECDFLSEKSSLYSDIIRDVQRDSIPGFDF